MRRYRSTAIPVFFAAGAAACAPACISVDSDLAEVAEGCQELDTGAAPEVEHPTVRETLEATLELRRVSEEMLSSVLQACHNVAVDLGAEPAWADIEDTRARISNQDGSGACDVASREIVAVLNAAVEIDAEVALATVPGACYLDFEAQAACEAGCAQDVACAPATIETRCEPAALSVMCHAACGVEGLCAGTPELPANCMGKCQSECQGDCKGSCVAPDGNVTENDPNCRGKCSSSCNGYCRGICKVEQPIECGAGVSCRGACTGEFSEPRCTSEFLPPACNLNTGCYAACTAEATANAVCDPPRVEVYANVNAMADGRLQILASTLEVNLPALIFAAETQGRLALASAQRLADAAEDLVEDVGDLDGKSLACSAAAAEISFEAAISIEVAFSASAQLLDACYGMTS